MSCTMLLLFLAMLASPIFASQPQQNQDPQTTHAPQPSNDPQHSSSSGAQAPSSGTQAHTPPAPPAQTETGANRRIQDSISDLLNSDPVLSGSDVDATVDDRNIVLTGKVQSHVQHERVLQLVSSYGRWRNIVDKIQ
jgi:predicted lipid-binding transport protein (Tim44 family)